MYFELCVSLNESRVYKDVQSPLTLRQRTRSQTNLKIQLDGDTILATKKDKYFSFNSKQSEK